LHDVLGSIGDFVSDGQAVHIVTTVFLHGIDKHANIFVDLVEISENLSFPPLSIKVGEGLREKRNLQSSRLIIIICISETLECGEDKLTDPDADEDGKTVLLGGSGGVVESGA
jgi:hypothetical protein